MADTKIHLEIDSNPNGILLLLKALKFEKMTQQNQSSSYQQENISDLDQMIDQIHTQLQNEKSLF